MPITNIQKRDGSIKAFNLEKVANAAHSAMKATDNGTFSDAEQVAQRVLHQLETIYTSKNLPTVEHVQDLTEKALMSAGFQDAAKAFILYRQRHAEERKRDIFKKRINLKPYEYPELAQYVDAIRHSYWIHTEFNFTSDIQDFKVHATAAEKTAIKNAMLAIAQIEIAVKTFWGDIFKKLPKPEIGAVGYTFAESEVRHHDAYSHLLEILGLNDEFSHLKDLPVINNRIHYLDKALTNSRSDDNQAYTQSILLFSLFIEHVSLFSQFLIIMSFNKYRNMFKGISNAVEATSKEEQIHGLFGIEVINIIRQEHPDWFDDDFKTTINNLCQEAYQAEADIIDWIFEAGELDYLPKNTVKEFVKNRLNNSLASIGCTRLFDIDPILLQQTSWFDDEIIATKHGDFFVKRSINYNKRSKSITSGDLF